MNLPANTEPSQLRIVMAQLNMRVGDVVGNAAHVIAAACRARDELHADAIVFPELTLTGYPPEDLLLRAELHERVLHGLEEIKRNVSGIDVIVGHPSRELSGLHNSASLIRDGKIVATYHKQHLPNYSVFDEKRYFQSGSKPCVVAIKGVPVGITICEDMWHPGPMGQAFDAGARLMLNLNASPFHISKGQEREEVLRQRIGEARMPVIYVNLVGGQDELVFDGESLVLDADGSVVVRGAPFVEGLYPVGGKGTAAEKFAALEAAGVAVVHSPAEMGARMLACIISQ